MPKFPDETLEQLRERLRKTKLSIEEDLFNNQSSDFDEIGLASGSEDLLHKSDAELFPDEIKEHTPQERRKKLIDDNKSDKD